MSDQSTSDLSIENLTKKNENYMRINADLTKKCQDFKMQLGLAFQQIQLLRNENIHDKFKVNSITVMEFIKFQRKI